MPLLFAVLLYCLTAVLGIAGLFVLCLLVTGLLTDLSHSQVEMRERESVRVKDEGQERGMDVDPEELHQVIHDADDLEADAGNDDGCDDGAGIDMLEHVNTSAIVIIIAGVSFIIMNHLMMALTIKIKIKMLDDD